MKKSLLALSIVLTIGFAAAGIAEAGLLTDTGNAPAHGLPYGSYRVSPLVNKVVPPPPPPPPPTQAWPPGNTPRLLRGGEVDNTDAGGTPVEPQTEKK